jgi:hypothetical protein
MLQRFHSVIIEAISHAAQDHGHADLAANIRAAARSGKLPQLLAILAPVALALLTGTPVDWAKLAAEIAALLQPAPANP